MKIGARDVFNGSVKSVRHGMVSVQGVVTLANGVGLTPAIPSGLELELKAGSAVHAGIKASNVIVAVH